ncbi:NUDIX domain-containing protein [Lysinibacillus sp. G4S2]|uniref:NUDIX domain-containing protein n=1 Tax=Lysinibacillus sp. G4S2 TaxID=3055859 RepID=UPI0025A107D3|nr:NUDIX domain-containing protein [Lysinibacillus sp. G4S2]MDM5247855.1 NUDIX domain-containing protein [Lysinibacillus sp. G4S2]
MHIRNSIKALIIEEDKILLTKNKYTEDYFYLCPGGGQEHGETFHAALIRECIEEIGCSVDIGELLFIREYIGKNHEHASFDFNAHQVEFYFVCQLARGKETNFQPTNPDSHQIGLEWVSIEDLSSYQLYPKELIKYIQQYNNSQVTPIYLGDIN